MAGIADAFIAESRKLLTEQHLPRIERCVDRLSDDEIWWRANEESNSVGNLLLHLTGNVGQWVVSGIGGAPDHRVRQQEFDQRRPIPRDELLSRLKNTVAAADRALAAVPADALLERRTIQGCDVTILEAIYHVIEHFSMHAGQIILLAKMRVGDMKFYEASDGIARPLW